jgi:hypothetical protein
MSQEHLVSITPRSIYMVLILALLHSMRINLQKVAQ